LNLIVAKSAGFCFGVKRAMDIAQDAGHKYPRNLYTLGPLIHNPQAVASLEQLGVKMRGRIEEIPRGTVIFRSHGVSKRDLEKAKKKGLRMIDATCPIVKKAQFFAKFLYRQKYSLLIVGDVHHPEVEAIRSYVDDRVDVVAEVKELERLGPWEKLGVIAQTTQSFTLFKEITAASLERAKEVRVFNTICQATTIRQREAVEIARDVDCMIVVGGYNSGNTQRLVSICKGVQPRTHHIEEARDLRPSMLAKRKQVGLTAGASTPFWIIQEVEATLKQLKKLEP
jgi:4-hydroxy-3-methylbut-2-enyl diphosphate reductase